jgi:signal transduction histidine kinase
MRDNPVRASIQESWSGQNRTYALTANMPNASGLGGWWEFGERAPMLLHEFMHDHRDEVLAACGAELQNAEASAGVLDMVKDFYDEMIRAMRRDSGIPESFSPLPQGSEVAARLGRERQRAGVALTKVAAVFGAISQAVAKTGARYELSISADEYKLLNQCLDAGVATSIENYWQRDKTQTAQRTTETFGYLAHELRNALGNANMSWRLMRAGDMNVRGRTGDVLNRNLLRMGMLIAQYLSTARQEAGHPLPLSPVSMASVLRDLEASTLADRGVRIVLEVDELLYVAADELLLSSAVGNLLHNAVKFSHDDGVITISAYAEEDVAFIRIDDACGGLHGVTLEDLCRPFATERQSKQPGSGLGLAITRSAVQAMNGALRLVDRPGSGCTFVMCFPLLTPA